MLPRRIRCYNSLLHLKTVVSLSRLSSMQMDTQLPDVETVFDSENMTQSPSKPGKGFHFWIVIGAICSSLFLGALELVNLIRP